MFRRVLSTLLVCLAVTAAARGDEPASWEWAAKKIQQATVTVRIGGDTPEDSQSPAVTVVSGLCIRDGRVVTAAFAGSDTPIRLTLPSGKQAEAKVQVVDEYSGLALLKADTASLVPLSSAEIVPAVGSELLTAAAWGLQQPLVSRGIVGGTDRKHPGANYPPLLQCDCVTMSTSTGAGLVDRLGRLIGVIVAADREGDRRGWAYAVPVAHVQRLLRAADEQTGDSIVLLKRRRPVVGMVLDQ